MSDIYKYRLLQDLPEYPKDTVFVLDDGWQAGSSVMVKFLSNEGIRPVSYY